MTNLLILHLLGAIPTLLLAIFIAVFAKGNLKILFFGTVYTTLTGIALAAITGQSFLSFCLRFTLYTAIIVLAYCRVYLTSRVETYTVKE